MANWVNKIIALVALLILSPILIMTAIGILLTDNGPIFYTTVRVGKDEKPFKLIKFRSMRTQSKIVGSRITSKNDSRIFWWGKIIRLLKIDELPQLINILKGEMAIIGPRPEDESIVKDAYNNLMLETLSVLPGLASPGSIYNFTHLEGMIDESDSENNYLEFVLPIKLKLDVVYVRNKTFFYDVQIIGRTILVIVKKIFGYEKFSEPKELEEAKNL